MDLDFPLLFELLNLECPGHRSSSLSMLTPLIISTGLMALNIHITDNSQLTSSAQTSLLIPRLLYIQMPSQHFYLDGQQSYRYIKLNMSKTELLTFSPSNPLHSQSFSSQLMEPDGQAQWSFYFLLFSLSTSHLIRKSSMLLLQAIYRI